MRRASEETKAKAVAEVAAGARIDQTMKKYKVGYSALHKWRKQAGMTASEKPVAEPEDFRAQIGTYLRETLETLAFQQRFFRDQEWLRKQTAADLAGLHAVCADRAIRICEAAERAYHYASRTQPSQLQP